MIWQWYDVDDIIQCSEIWWWYSSSDDDDVMKYDSIIINGNDVVVKW